MTNEDLNTTQGVAKKERGMVGSVGVVLLPAAAVGIFFIARQYPFTGTVILEFQERWLWLASAAILSFAGCAFARYDQALIPCLLSPLAHRPSVQSLVTLAC